MLRNRERELGYLDTRYASGRAELVVLYGRRRVGKTTLAYYWAQEKPHVFFFATRDDSETLLRRFSQLIRQTGGWSSDPTFAFPDWETALRTLGTLARERRFVVLMDLRMPLLDGVATTRRLQAVQPDCRVIALTTFDDDEYVFETLRAGAVGYLLKDVPSPKLFEAIRAAARGDSFLQPSVVAKVVTEFARLADQAPSPGPPLVEPLSDRELQVLRLIATGATNREIAAQLCIALGMVKNHATSILVKLGVSDRTQAALKARDLGLV